MYSQISVSVVYRNLAVKYKCSTTLVIGTISVWILQGAFKIISPLLLAVKINIEHLKVLLKRSTQILKGIYLVCYLRRTATIHPIYFQSGIEFLFYLFDSMLLIIMSLLNLFKSIFFIMARAQNIYYQQNSINYRVTPTLPDYSLLLLCRTHLHLSPLSHRIRIHNVRAREVCLLDMSICSHGL